jgi:dipeptidyl-peptidase-4
MPSRLTVLARGAALLAVAAAAPASAQAGRALTQADYARAEKFMSWSVAPLVSLPATRPTWLPEGRFWYRRTTPAGTEFWLVDPARGTRERAFDQGRLAAALATATRSAADSLRLPFTTTELSADGKTLTGTVSQRRYTCDLAAYRCVEAAGRGAGPNEIVSPDGRKAAFVRDFNLWVRDLESGRETQLTTDGIRDFGYATNNAGWVRSERPVLLWSPDSRRIATFQQDGRGVGEMYLVRTQVGHPTLDRWKYPLVGDSAIFMLHRVIVDLGGTTPRVVRLRVPPDPQRSTLCDHIVCGGEWVDVEWAPEGDRLAFVSSSRDHREARLRVADAATGEVREVLEERVPAFFESGTGRVSWRVLPASNEVIWFSQRDDWGHLYLYDLRTGALKNRITSGAGNVLQVLKVDPRSRTIWFTGAGREAGRDPYLRHLYRVGFDGSGLRLLTPEDADHDVSLSPDGRFIVDSYSRVDVPPVTVLRDMDGRVMQTLERGDVSRLAAAGWTPPVPFTVKARDGRTDLYGLMYRPTAFDSTRKYPIINHIYPGPQTGSVGTRSFSAARGDARALAELGFIVVQIDAMGTPMRSKSFHAAYYGNMGDNGLPDQVAGMRELARRHAYIDLERAGIYGHSGGGYAAAGAMFRYPDFFKVGVSQAGNHDNRNYEDDWAEKWVGLLERRPDGTTNYDDQANQNHAANLKGKLLLAHGTLDDNVPPDNTLLVVDALIRANKDFDLVMFPNRRHGFGNEPYMVRRRWDYFVRHLMGAEPPREYEFNVPAPAR